MFQPHSILITGASSGLGAALSLAYAAPDTELFLCGRNRRRLSEIAAACRAKGATVYPYLCDVRDAEGMSRWIAQCDDMSGIDLVIANAGISGGTAGDPETEEQTLDIFEVNLAGTLNTILPLIPRMTARRRGQIAIMSSLAGYRGMPSAPSYSASKAAVKAYGEGLRGSLAPFNVGVTVICPGFITTPMTAVNRFKMPFIMLPERAAVKIRNRLKRNPATLAFPLPLVAALWAVNLLPSAVSDWLVNLLPGKTSHTLPNHPAAPAQQKTEQATQSAEEPEETDTTTETTQEATEAEVTEFAQPAAETEQTYAEQTYETEQAYEGHTDENEYQENTLAEQELEEETHQPA